MRVIRGVMPFLVLTLSACASTASRPVVGDPPLQPGQYTFQGVIHVEDRYQDRTRTTSELVSGSLLIRPDGTVMLASTHGTCHAGRLEGGLAALGCGGIHARIGPRTGTMRVMVSEVQEVWSTRCAVIAPRSVGGAPPPCLRYETELRYVQRPRTADLMVARVD